MYHNTTNITIQPYTSIRYISTMHSIKKKPKLKEHRPCTTVHAAVFACTKHDGAKKHLLH